MQVVADGGVGGRTERETEPAPESSRSGEPAPNAGGLSAVCGRTRGPQKAGEDTKVGGTWEREFARLPAVDGELTSGSPTSLASERGTVHALDAGDYPVINQ